MDVKKLLQNLELKKLECDFWDVRVEDVFETNITFTNNDLTTCLEQKTLGAFLRIRKNGSWFYSALTDLSNIEKEFQTLVDNAQGASGKKWNSSPPKLQEFNFLKYTDVNFSTISIKEKKELIESYSKIPPSFKEVKTHSVRYKDQYKVKTYRNSEGTSYQYDFSSGGFYVIYSMAAGENNFSDFYIDYGDSLSKLKGKEEEIKNYISDSLPFLTAPSITPGKYQLVLAPEVTGVFTHESFGHKSEADFILGDPSAKEDWKLGSRVAAPIVSIVDSGSHFGTSGYCPIDDEGHLATKTYLIQDGILKSRLHSKETSLELQEKNTGNGRALNFEFAPIVRMTSTYIENGKTPLPEIFKMAEGGLYIQGVNNGSGLSTFTIAPVRAYYIRDGKPKDPVRVSVISGSVFETLENIIAVGDDFELKSSALGGCGKMDQGPLPVADGGPSILVNNMQVS